MRRSAVLLLENRGIIEKTKAKIFGAADLLKDKVKDMKDATGMNQKSHPPTPPQTEMHSGNEMHGQNVAKEPNFSERNQAAAARGQKINRKAERDVKNVEETPDKEPLDRPL